ncbi:3'-5' exonuclease [Bacillus andreraoultii]|uniref:3'-5' exonuclease n=1 Tax=Bacillus andreraoultii TaxID=1499685 RepID=UPI000539BAAD|nr:3'-5' exonuclease [Bacillus andreraoultii]
MNFIVFDLEWSPTFRHGKFIGQEITEIGAVEVSEIDGLLIIGRSFHSYVRTLKPVTKKIKKLTNLQEPDTWLAPRFPIVMKRFEKWIGNKSYIYCSWGGEDRVVLLKNLLFHQISTDVFQQYMNLQDAFSLAVHEKKQFGLVKAIERLELSYEGTPHCSIDDAFNTASILLEIHNKGQMKTEPFVNNQLLDFDYRKRVNKFIRLRRKLNLNDHDLSLLTNISEKELERIETFQLTKSKKEMNRLIELLYLVRGETLGKR